MRIPAFLAKVWRAPSAVPAPAPREGLDAFASESDSSPGVRSSEAGNRRGPRAVNGALLLLVLLQVVPTGLWLRERFATSTTAAAASEAEPVAPSPVAAAPPCEPPAASLTASKPPVAVGTGSGRSAPEPARPALSAGRLTVSAPLPMRVYSRGKLVGTTEAESIMLPVGRHELDFVSETTGYRTSRRVDVQAARTSQITLEPPSGTVHVNALPWAEVWLDGHRIGETPIGNHKATIGQREVVFRHPDLGERRATVLVTLKAPARVSMDMRQK